MKKKPILNLVIPCYNEEEALPFTKKELDKKMNALIKSQLIDENSKVVLVNDGSKDKTWEIICDLAKQDTHFEGVCLSRNRGHQNALLAGLMTAKEKADVTISIDCDGM